MLSKIFTFIINCILFLGTLIFLYYPTSNLFFTIKNWNTIQEGVITKTWTFKPVRTTHAPIRMYNVKVKDFVFESKSDLEFNLNIGDKVAVQYRGDKTVKILYVNGVKVANKMESGEYISFFLIPLLVLIITLYILTVVKTIKKCFQNFVPH